MASVTFDESYSEEDYLSAIQRDFTNRASVYDEGFSGSHHREIIDTILNFYPPAYPVLDIACGTGLLAACLPDKGRGVTGIDLTPAMLTEAAHSSPEATFVQGRAEKLPFPDNSFGSAYCCAALVYFTDIDSVLREARRVLQPGGFLAYQAVTLDSYVAGVALETALVEVLGEMRGRQTFQLPHGVTHTREANERMMQRAGFQDVRTEMVTMRTQLEMGGAEAWWHKLKDGNALTRRVGLLPATELERVRERYIAFLEGQRNAENVVEDKICSWYVQGTKVAI